MCPVTLLPNLPETFEGTSPRQFDKGKATFLATMSPTSPRLPFLPVKYVSSQLHVNTNVIILECDELPGSVQEQLFAELLDKDAQEQLESDPAVINWSLELTVRLGSRLYALWNRSSGDCLLDSVMQATWGVFDRDNTLRRALAESLGQGGHM